MINDGPTARADLRGAPVHYYLPCKRAVNGRRELAPSPPRVSTDTAAPGRSGSDRTATTMSQPHSCPDVPARGIRSEPTIADRSADASDQSK